MKTLQTIAGPKPEFLLTARGPNGCFMLKDFAPQNVVNAAGSLLILPAAPACVTRVWSEQGRKWLHLADWNLN